MAGQLVNRALSISKMVRDQQDPFAQRGADKKDTDHFLQQVKYWMAYKWMDFGSPAEGKGVNTVVVAGHAMRKNILGNIAFGFITAEEGLPVPGYNGIVAVSAGYKFAGNGQYDKEHPHHRHFGKFEGVFRADNLAAFGVGRGVLRDLQQQNRAIWNKIKNETARGQFKADSLNADQRKSLISTIEKSLRDIFGSTDTLSKRVGEYQKIINGLDLVGAVDGKPKISINSLFFIPDYGGFNTDSLDKSQSKELRPALQSGVYFDTVLIPSFNKRAVKSVIIDDWLRIVREDYRVQVPVP